MIRLEEHMRQIMSGSTTYSNVSEDIIADPTLRTLVVRSSWDESYGYVDIIHDMLTPLRQVVDCQDLCHKKYIWDVLRTEYDINVCVLNLHVKVRQQIWLFDCLKIKLWNEHMMVVRMQGDKFLK